MTDRPPRDPSDRDELGERIAAPLRAPVTLGDDFDARVMRDVRAAAASGTSVPWWRKRYVLRVTPFAGAALAASLALAALLGRASVRPRNDDATGVVAAQSDRDTVYLVRFTFVHPEAHRVALVGDFNGWSPEATPLDGEAVNGVWSVSVPMTAGRHEYAFIVDGERWVSDPFAGAVTDEFGTSSSILRIGTAS